MLITFGEENGQDWTHLGAGWRRSQPRFRASQGLFCELWLEHPGDAVDSVLEVDVEAANQPYRVQRITVVLRGEVIGRSVIGPRRRAAYAVPGRLLAASGPIRLDFRHVPGEQPIDPDRLDPKAPALIFRSLRLRQRDAQPIQIEPVGGLEITALAKTTGITSEEFIRRFESIGENCEFGFVQRRCGAEPLSLLRFGAPRLPKLITCLRDRFAGFGNEDNLELVLTNGRRREYMIREKPTGMFYHSRQFEDEVEPASVRRQQGRRLKFLVRKFLEDLEAGEKIIVWRPNHTWAREEDVLALHDALLEIGPCPLLWAECANFANPAGSLVEIRPGLLRGHVHGFTGLGNIHTVEVDRWLGVCTEAHRHFASKEEEIVLLFKKMKQTQRSS